MAPEVAGSIPVTHPTHGRRNSRQPGRSGGSLVARLTRLAFLVLLTASCVQGGAGGEPGSSVQGGAGGEPGSPTRAPSRATGGTNDPSVADRPYVVLVSFDGFRPDYLERFSTPSFDRLAAAGVRTVLVPAFPSLTFPTHYTIATGLYPEHHGIVANRFYDPVRDAEFDYRDRATVEDGSWWGASPSG